MTLYNQAMVQFSTHAGKYYASLDVLVLGREFQLIQRLGLVEDGAM